MQTDVRRGWAALPVGVILVAAACAPPSSALPQASPTAQTSPTTEASPSPTGEPSATPSTSPLAITSAAFHTGEVGVVYTSVNLAATGGVSPYQWQISTGFLPSGLHLAGNSVSGTPTSQNTWYFTVRVLDAAGQAATAKRAITIARRMTASQVCPTPKPCQVEAGCVTVCGKFGILAGGVGQYTFQLTYRQIPTGMGRNGLSLTGTFPTTRAASTWIFTVTVTDSLGVSVPVPADFYVFPHIAFAASSLNCQGELSFGCSATMKYTLGTPGLAVPTVKITSGPTPPLTSSLSYSARSGTFSVSVAPPGCRIQADFASVVTFVLVDTSICGAGAYCTSAPLKVNISLINSC